MRGAGAIEGDQKEVREREREVRGSLKLGEEFEVFCLVNLRLLLLV